jgi:hypothetical protein
MKKQIVVALIITMLFGFTLTLSGCGGGGAKLESKVNTQTLGQQLIDLDKAHKEGVIDDKEYKKDKDSLIKSYK